MNTLNFAHNGIGHSNALDAAVHQAASNIVWLAASAIALAIVLYIVVSVLNRPQPQEIRREEQDRR